MRRFVKTFLHTFLYSLIPQADFYHRLRRRPYKASLIYFFTLVFVVNAFFFGFFAATHNIFDLISSQSAVKQSLMAYPKDLRIHIASSRLATNYDHPYFVWLTRGDRLDLFAVVDEWASAEKIKEYNSFLLFTSNNLVVRNPKNIKNGYTLLPLPDQNTPVTISKANVGWLIDRVDRSWVPFVITIAVFIFVFIPAVLALVLLVLLGILSYISFLILRLRYKKHTLAKTYQLALHAVSFPLITIYTLYCLAFGIRGFAPPLFIFLILVFVLAGLYESYYDEMNHKSA